MQDFDLNIITLRTRHHANVSGDDQLIKYLDMNVVTTNYNFDLFQTALICVCRSKIRKSNPTWYHRANFITEAKAALKWITKKSGFSFP